MVNVCVQHEMHIGVFLNCKTQATTILKKKKVIICIAFYKEFSFLKVSFIKKNKIGYFTNHFLSRSLRHKTICRTHTKFHGKFSFFLL